MHQCCDSRSPARAQSSSGGLSEQVKGSNKKILKTVMDESEDTIHSYMEMLHADLPFVRVFGLYGED